MWKVVEQCPDGGAKSVWQIRLSVIVLATALVAALSNYIPLLIARLTRGFSLDETLMLSPLEKDSFLQSLENQFRLINSGWLTSVPAWFQLQLGAQPEFVWRIPGAGMVLCAIILFARRIPSESCFEKIAYVVLILTNAGTLMTATTFRPYSYALFLTALAFWLSTRARAKSELSVLAKTILLTALLFCHPLFISVIPAFTAIWIQDYVNGFSKPRIFYTRLASIAISIGGALGILVPLLTSRASTTNWTYEGKNYPIFLFSNSWTCTVFFFALGFCVLFSYRHSSTVLKVNAQILRAFLSLWLIPPTLLYCLGLISQTPVNLERYLIVSSISLICLILTVMRLLFRRTIWILSLCLLLLGFGLEGRISVNDSYEDWAVILSEAKNKFPPEEPILFGPGHTEACNEKYIQDSDNIRVLNSPLYAYDWHPVTFPIPPYRQCLRNMPGYSLDLDTKISSLDTFGVIVPANNPIGQDISSRALASGKTCSKATVVSDYQVFRCS